MTKKLSLYRNQTGQHLLQHKQHTENFTCNKQDIFNICIPGLHKRIN